MDEIEQGMLLEEGMIPQGNPEPGVEPGGLESILKSAIDDAVDYAESDLASKRQEAIDSYRGEGLENDADLDATRSKAMSRDSHDTVMAMMPSLLRVFFSGQEVVSYQPVGPEDEAYAKQATDYVNMVILRQDNPGFMIFHSAFKDALIKALGVFKWWWEENYSVEAQEYSGLDQMTFQILAGDPSVIEIYDYIEDQMGFINCTISYRRVTGGKVRVEAVPPEERLISRNARSIDDADFYGHRRDMKVSDLVAMGFDFDQLMELSGSSSLETNEEAVERYDTQTNFADTPVDSDPSQRTVEVVEAYVRVDLDADGVAELYRIFCGGSAYSILIRDGEEAIDLFDEIPFAELCPDPEPHLATGHSIVEQTEDLQRIKSGLLRGTLDSLSRAIFPREEVVEQAVNMDDVLNTEIGATIRTQAPGMIREIVTPFMGKECLPVMEYLDSVKADRTGISDATQGLDPQAMQSTTAAGVSATVSAANNQIEMVARILAQTGVTKLFNGILKLLKQHQDQPRTVKLLNTWTAVDPRNWGGLMDAQVNTALGRGTDSEKMAMLNMVAQRQEKALEVFGPQNALCTVAEYRNTLAEMVTLAGYFNPDKFFLPVETGSQIQQLMQQMQQMQGELQQLQQQNAYMSMELQKRNQAKDIKDMADAGKKQAETLDTLVDAAQKAVNPVPPNALDDEVAATSKFMQ